MNYFRVIFHLENHIQVVGMDERITRSSFAPLLPVRLIVNPLTNTEDFGSSSCIRPEGETISSLSNVSRLFVAFLMQALSILQQE